MADELRVVITADASGVGPAVAQATAAVEASSDQIAAAQAKATAATKALTAAQVQLGAAAEAGSSAAAAIIAEYAAASAEAQAAVAALAAAQQESVASATEASEAYQTLAAATIDLTAAKAAVAQTSREIQDGELAEAAGAQILASQLVDLGAATDAVAAAKAALGIESDAITGASEAEGASYLAVARATIAATEAKVALAAVNKAISTGAIAGTEAEEALAVALAQQTAATEALTAAKEALTTAELENSGATDANAESQNLDTKATYNRTEAMGAARVAMGAMDGSMGMMGNGIARIAAGSSTLGPLLASMVPIAIFAAGAFLLYDLGEAIYKAFDLGGEGARQFQLKLSDLDGSYRSLIDETSLEADKIEAANAKLEHQPNPNAMKEAIDQALADADKMDGKLQGLIGKEEALLKMQSLAGSTLERLTVTTGDRQAQVDLEQHALWMEKAVSLEQQLAEAKSFTAVEEKKLVDLHVQQTMSPVIVASDPLGRQISATEILIADTKKETEAIQEQMRLRDAQTTHEALTKSPKAGRDDLPEQIARAQIDAAHAADAELAPQQEIVAAMDKQIELNNLKARFSKEGTAAERETLRVMENQIALSQAKEKIDALGREQLNRTFEEEQKAQAEAQRRQQEQARAALEESNRMREEQISDARETAAATIEAANQEFERTQTEIRGQEELGLISHRVAEQRLLDALALREATTQGALKNEQGLFNPALGNKEAMEYKKLEDQMTKEAQRAALERERIVQQEATKIEQIYKKVANEFNTDFTRAFNEWATKSQTAGQAFGRMLGDMELQVIDFVAKWILQKVEMWAMNKLLDATGYATQFAIQKTANVAAVTSDAGVAAAGAMAYYSAINPPMAPAMAAVQFAETMSYAVMDNGGMMPHMGFAFNTSGSAERVLSPSQTQNFESMVNQGGSRSATLNYAPTIHGSVNEDMLKEHSAKLMTQVRSMLRPEALA